MKRLESVERDGFMQHKVEFPVSSDGEILHANLLVPFYESFTSIGLRDEGRGTLDYGPN